MTKPPNVGKRKTTKVSRSRSSDGAAVQRAAEKEAAAKLKDIGPKRRGVTSPQQYERMQSKLRQLASSLSNPKAFRETAPGKKSKKATASNELGESNHLSSIDGVKVLIDRYRRLKRSKVVNPENIERAFFEAAKAGDIGLMSDIYGAHKPDINAPVGAARTTALHGAAGYGQTEAVQWLLDKTECDPSREDAFRRSAAVVAIHTHQNEDLKDMLLEAELARLGPRVL